MAGDSPDHGVPFVESVFHPSDFSEESSFAFAHALAVALGRPTELTIMHASSSREDEDWRRFPPVRKTLERWGLLDPGSPRTAVFDELALRIKKVNVHGRDPAEAVVHFLAKNPTDLIVLATEGRRGMPRWLRSSAAERIARESRTMTLFVSAEARGFVSPSDGAVTIRRILIPVDHRPDPWAALVYATRVAGAMAEEGCEPVELIRLHVGDSPEIPPGRTPEAQNGRWVGIRKEGDVVEEIVNVAKERNVDAIFVPTDGHRGFLDALRGTVSEQVVRKAPCAVLAVPSL